MTGLIDGGGRLTLTAPDRTVLGYAQHQHDGTWTVYTAGRTTSGLTRDEAHRVLAGLMVGAR